MITQSREQGLGVRFKAGNLSFQRFEQIEFHYNINRLEVDLRGNLRDCTRLLGVHIMCSLGGWSITWGQKSESNI
jgi:hypothetical protein